MIHTYSVGQLVHAADMYFADRTSGIHEVTRMMPKSDGEFGCRIKTTPSGTDRVAGASQIRAINAGHSVRTSVAANR